MLTSRRHVKLELGIVESEQHARSERGCVASATGIFGEQFWSPDSFVLHFGTLSRGVVSDLLQDRRSQFIYKVITFRAGGGEGYRSDLWMRVAFAVRV